jgi:hypothetical protein
MSELAVLRQAFEWTCDNCGHDQFERAITLDRESDQYKHLVKDHRPTEEFLETQFEVEIQTDLLMAPDFVTCNSCGAKYQAIN